MSPRFYGREQTGTLFGAAGYYRSIPVWKSGNAGILYPYQMAGFQVNAGYSYDVDGTLPNPFLYQPTPSASQYVGSLATATSDGTACGSMGAGSLSLNSAYLNTTLNRTFFIASYQAEIPNLVQKDTKFRFSARQQIQQLSVGFGCLPINNFGLVDTGPSPSFLLENDFGLDYLYQFGGVDETSNYPPDFSFQPCIGPPTVRYFYNGIAQDYYPTSDNRNQYDSENPDSSYCLPRYYQLADGSVQAVYNGKNNFSGSFAGDNLVFKVDAGTGNYIRLFSSKNPIAGICWYGGNVWCSTDILGNITTKEQLALSLEDMTDNGLFQSALINNGETSIQQIPGGGFLIFDFYNYPGVMFLVSRDLRRYVRVNISGWNEGFGYPQVETMTMDASGFFNFLQYGTNYATFEQGLYSGPGKTIISLSGTNLSPVSSWSTICRSDDTCSEPWEA